MRTVTGRRRRLGAYALVAAAALSATVVGTAPASAASDALWVQSPEGATLSVTPGSYQEFSFGLYHDNGDYHVVNGVLTLDLSELAGVAEVSVPDNCFLSESGTSAVCDIWEVGDIGGSYDGPQVTLGLRTMEGAPAGAELNIGHHAQAETDGPDGVLYSPWGSTPVKVESVPSPDLSLTEPAPVGPVAPGTSLTVPVTVTNNGDAAADGFRLRVWNTYGLEFATTYPGCALTPPVLDTEAMPGGLLDCTFDTVVEPGATVTLPQPLRLTVASHALIERLDIDVQPLEGTQDQNPEDNTTSMPVTAENTADFAVRGDEVTGAAGETVTATIRFRNRGPAWFANVGSGDPVGTVTLAVPEGTTVVSAPENCWADGSATYRCELRHWVAPKDRFRFPFELRVDRVVPNATGAVTLHPSAGQAPYDPKPRNGHAELVVNASE
ncbi:hypothetical protein SSP24_38680 [Streptomyces spinoverrucosus]|uniref:CARDB domain-containing protein n=1 Tax=Streptomyces spinoverrucosus TaxID=284043 RepID=A0A4Y3VI60_9ACTN|nr:hypothetical protein [Streptomyces spinoverrucosus]GEC06213.1 hypothetical protein SSP24_38680 [Streptomyces spinoverrucosus]GHB75447.1 hypothetical protein GCM10010397_52250 [Streptomyces spinoverrucosus]